MTDKSSIGAIGENIVITELLWNSWLPVNVNSIVKHAANIDVIATKGSKKVSIQVKTSGPNSKTMLHLGHGPREKIFNGKDGPKADFIVFVRLFGPKNYECYVVPTPIAEMVAQETCLDWLETPMKDGSKRTGSFPLCIRFELNKNRPDVSNYKERWNRYLDAWDTLLS